jgi:basic amino acid/polyamine antiporter, APA family
MTSELSSASPDQGLNRQRSNGSGELVRGLRLVDATTIVMGSMIGSGIFIVSADVARQLPSPGLLLITWLVAAALTLACAVSYGALAAALPYSGGQYVYLREAFGPMWGFLYGWAMFLVIQTGTIAAVCVAFGKFLGVLVPGISASNFLFNFGAIALPGTTHFIRFSLTTEQCAAIYCAGLLTALNCYGLRVGAIIQNLFTFTKTGALLGLVLAGALIGRNHQAIEANVTGFWRHADWSYATLSLVAVAMVGPLFAADAWNNITFASEEVQNPRRNLPLSLVLGVGVVSILYLLTNLVYLIVLPLEGSAQGATVLERGIQFAASDRVGTAAAEVMLGHAGLYVMAVAIMISTFGCANGMILAGARIYYAMARDGVFFSSAAEVHPRYRTPVFALVIQGIWTAILTLSGTYSQLLDYIVFTVLLFYMLTLVALFVLRRRIAQQAEPRETPRSSWGYPWLPVVYIAVVGFIEINLLLYKPSYTWPGLIIVLLGVPVYVHWKRKR